MYGFVLPKCLVITRGADSGTPVHAIPLTGAAVFAVPDKPLTFEVRVPVSSWASSGYPIPGEPVAVVGDGMVVVLLKCMDASAFNELLALIGARTTAASVNGEPSIHANATVPRTVGPMRRPATQSTPPHLRRTAVAAPAPAPPAAVAALPPFVRSPKDSSPKASVVKPRSPNAAVAPAVRQAPVQLFPSFAVPSEQPIPPQPRSEEVDASILHELSAALGPDVIMDDIPALPSQAVFEPDAVSDFWASWSAPAVAPAVTSQRESLHSMSMDIADVRSGPAPTASSASAAVVAAAVTTPPTRKAAAATSAPRSSAASSYLAGIRKRNAALLVVSAPVHELGSPAVVAAEPEAAASSEQDPFLFLKRSPSPVRSQAAVAVETVTVLPSSPSRAATPQSPARAAPAAAVASPPSQQPDIPHDAAASDAQDIANVNLLQQERSADLEGLKLLFEFPLPPPPWSSTTEQRQFVLRELPSLIALFDYASK